MQLSTPPQVRRSIVVALGATVAAWLIALGAWLLHLGPVYSWPLPTGTPGWDYYDYFNAFRLIHTPAFFTEPGFPFTYMPSGVLLYRAFYSLGIGGGYVLYMAIAIAGVVFGAARLNEALRRRGVPKLATDALTLALVLTSYPLAFCLHRGNLEIVLAIGIAIGGWAYRSGSTFMAAMLWGLSGSVKIYPLLLLAIFLSARQYRQFLVSAGAALAATLAGLLYTGPTILAAFTGARLSMAAFLQMYPLRYDKWLRFDHSLFCLLKIALRPLHLPLPLLLGIYLPVFGLAGALLYFARVRHLPFEKQFLFLTAVSILLPPTSFDYMLIQLYAPFTVLLFAAIDGRLESPPAIFTTLALLFTPTNFLFLHGEGYAGQIKACLLLVVLWLSSRAKPLNQKRLPL